MIASELVSEFNDRGFDYVPDPRALSWLNAVYQEWAGEEEWPWLYTSTTGTAPVTVSDVRSIESVIDTTTQVKLKPLDRRHITDLSTDLTITGSPDWYYFSGETAVNVYPANSTDTLSIRYWKVPAVLSAGDTPAMPARWHMNLVDGMCIWAYRDSDNPDMANYCREQFELAKDRMREELLVQQRDRPDDFIVQASFHEDATF